MLDRMYEKKVEIGNATLYLGDSAKVVGLLDNIDSCVADGPYGLSFMGKSWDYDVPQASFWKSVHDALKPGAHLLNFASARTYHRMAVQVEDAGFEIRDQIMWLYGSGFPKSQNIAKGIEALVKTGGAAPINQRKAAMGADYTLSPLAGTPGYAASGNMFRADDAPYGKARAAWDGPELDITNDEAKLWQGWGTNLKPAHEPIVLARKSFRGSATANVLHHGTGAINIKASRVEGGRWPANVVHDGSDAIVSAFSTVKTGKASKHQSAPNTIYGQRGSDATGERSLNGGDNGSAARFFYCAKASTKDRDEGLENFATETPVFFQTANGTSGKASMEGKSASKPRANVHPTVKPTDLMRYLCRLVTPAGGIILDPFLGSGSTGKAALLEGFRFVGIERDPEYFEIACARIAAAQGLR